MLQLNVMWHSSLICTSGALLDVYCAASSIGSTAVSLVALHAIRINMYMESKSNLSPALTLAPRYLDDVEVQQEQASIYVVLDGLLSRYHRQGEHSLTQTRSEP